MLSAFHRSGQSQAGFCSEHGLSVSSLQYQLRRERSRPDDPGVEASSSPRLVEIMPVHDRDSLPAEPRPALRVECSLDSPRVTIECPPGQLAQLLGGLSSFHDQREARR